MTLLEPSSVSRETIDETSTRIWKAKTESTTTLSSNDAHLVYVLTCGQSSRLVVPRSTRSPTMESVGVVGLVGAVVHAVGHRDRRGMDADGGNDSEKTASPVANRENTESEPSRVPDKTFRT